MTLLARIVSTIIKRIRYAAFPKETNFREVDAVSHHAREVTS
jgi:hypothetical protein